MLVQEEVERAWRTIQIILERVGYQFLAGCDTKGLFGSSIVKGSRVLAIGDGKTPEEATQRAILALIELRQAEREGTKCP